jgi:flagellar biosynthesis chaperone FliJ
MNEVIKQTRRQKDYAKMKANTPEGMPMPATRLRFPIIDKNVEYLDVINNKLTVKSYKAEDIGGLSWRKVNEKLYEDGVPAGKYSYAMKFLKNDNIYRGFIKSVDAKNEHREIDPNVDNLKKIQNTIEGLKENLRSASSGSSLGIDYIMAATQRSHEAEVAVYKMQIDNLKETIRELKSDISELNNELEQAEKIVNELQSSSSNNKLTETLLGLISQIKKP